MTQPGIRLALVVGSTREGRFGPTVARWFARRAEQFGRYDVDVVDLVETPVPADLTGRPGPTEQRALAAVTPRLAAADAFVLVTPEYNHSFPGALKNLIDWHSVEWHARPVGFVSYGGLSGGLRAVEQLRPVLAEVHAVTVRETVSFHGFWDRFGADGEPTDPGPCNAAADKLLAQLAWWSDALREARARSPYPV
ncbi:NADPH-dependent FMN reductase [Micromonospora echinofusca]|uniref:NADPH-dependent FMN reductase n=1 Tax=Micromonospora echinofusca TaxID=47858 RepID=A0ABS3VZ48_MICEH|nr:NAD(P)H-dependent oxidoreductase [Micromonospora echinofusca]MBO4209613.1 NADPH-dependent FMN reductase [Micromonospora echinofusca]